MGFIREAVLGGSIFGLLVGLQDANNSAYVYLAMNSMIKSAVCLGAILIIRKPVNYIMREFRYG